MNQNEIKLFLNKIKFKWTTKDEEILLIKDMNPNHLWNTYKRAIKKGNRKNELIFKLALSNFGTANISDPECEELLSLLVTSNDDIKSLYEKYEEESYMDDIDFHHTITNEKYR